MSASTRALLVDTEGHSATSRTRMLEAAGFDTERVDSIADAVDRLRHANLDLVVLAHALGGLPALDQLSRAPGAVGVPIVVLMPDEALADAAAALRSGASDAVAVSAECHALPVAAERARREGMLRRELAMLRAQAGSTLEHALVGRSGTMTRVRELIARAAASRAAALVMGEAGSGKDVVARMLHELSDRAGGPFVIVRCGGESAAALETRLFGEGALGDEARGALADARGGSLVLDDASALPAALQVKLARALANRSIRDAQGDGSTTDARVILTSRVAADGSRSEANEDMIARFNALPISMPPLRDRRSDIPLLAQHFRAQVAARHRVELGPIGSDALLPLMGHDWPGNVRELAEWVERTALTPTAARPDGASRSPSSDITGIDIGSAQVTLDQLERAYILHVLGQEAGHQSRAAVRLGIDRRTLYRKLKQYRSEGVLLQQAG